MTEQEQSSRVRGSHAGAREPAAERRSDLPQAVDADSGVPDSDLHDISKILLGAQASTGKAQTAAGRMTASESDARHQQQRRQEQEARERANLARWNTLLTTVGGVRMTNAEAQTARQNVIDNDDAYADWAVRKGLISADQKDEFKRAARRSHELADKEGRGTLTAVEAEEQRQLRQHPVGVAVDAATARDYQHQGVAPVAENSKPSADAAMRGKDIATDRPALFQSAPRLDAAFEMASADLPEKKAPATPVAPAIKATGLDL